MDLKEIKEYRQKLGIIMETQGILDEDELLMTIDELIEMAEKLEQEAHDNG